MFYVRRPQTEYKQITVMTFQHKVVPASQNGIIEMFMAKINMLISFNHKMYSLKEMLSIQQFICVRQLVIVCENGPSIKMNDTLYQSLPCVFL